MERKILLQMFTKQNYTKGTWKWLEKLDKDDIIQTTNYNIRISKRVWSPPYKPYLSPEGTP